MESLKEILQQTKDLKMLYVEDDLLMQKSSVEMFSNFFSNITVANNGEEGLFLYNENTYDVIITDISMPRMDGIEMITHIRQDDESVPIIVFSAWNDASSMAACISLNIDAYMLKPLDSKNLIDAIRKVTLKIQNTKEKFKKYFETDKLTNLKSHSAFLEDKEKTTHLEIPVIILINIDEFRVYNELYGLDVGDEILISFAKILKDFSTNLSYELYRMGGDEFILFEKVKILDSDKYTQDIENMVEYIDTHAIRIEGIKEKISLNITIGISFHKDNIYGRADMALQEARKRGRHYLGFSADADRREELKNNLYWREEINKALSNNNVHTYYQPIVDKDENILKYESLVRIEKMQPNGEIKLISPSEFIDFSKVSKQYIALTKVVIEESFETMIQHNVHVAINITFHDIENREINKLLHEKISKHNLATKTKFDISSQVIFELLEHKTHEDYDRFISFVDEFKALGVLITIDNFGLGFANISKISALAPNYVKIDSSLMKNIDTDIHSYALVNAIVKFAQELGIKTIAEHVSSEKIFEMSKKLGIDEFQGFYFSQPLKSIVNKEP